MSLEDVSAALERAQPGIGLALVVGIGNEISSDDGVGPFVISLLQGKARNLRLLDTGPVPENFVSKMASLGPSHIIIVDAATVGSCPGDVRLVDPAEVDDVIFTTHHISLGRTLARLAGRHRCEITIIGVRPATVETGAQMTREVRVAGEGIAALLMELDSALGPRGRSA